MAECIIWQGGKGFVEEKKSKFISEVIAVHSEEEAQSAIERIRKEHYDARHNCYAYVIGERDEITRSSDDGEPSGTAGRPILEVIKGASLRNALIVVTRYFGGTLLGTGGLIRAYTAAAKDGIKNAVVGERLRGEKLRLAIPYPDLGKIEYICRERGFAVLESSYAEQVSFLILVPEELSAGASDLIRNESGGRVNPASEGMCFYLQTGDAPILL